MSTISDDIKAAWAEVKTWFETEWKTFSTAELALLKSEIPTITAAGAAALEDFVIQEAQSLEQTAMGGAQKAATLGQTVTNALAKGLTVINGSPVQASDISKTLLAALVEAGATAAKIGLASLMAG